MTVELLPNRPTRASRAVALAEDSFSVAQLSDWSDALPTRRGPLLRLAGLVILLVFVIGGTWAATAKIGGAVSASGRVVAEGTNTVVQHLEGGIIDSILVREGEAVPRGQELATIDVTAQRSQRNAIRVQQAILTIELGRWRAQNQILDTVDFGLDAFSDVMDDPRVKETLTSQLTEFQASRDVVERRLAIYDAQIANENEDIGSLEELSNNYRTQLDLVTGELTGLRELLASELTTANRVNTMERTVAQLNAQLAQSEFTVNKSRHNILAAQQEKEGVLLEVKEEANRNITRVQSELNVLADQELRLRDIIDRAVVRAPVDGTVFRINFKSVGAVLPRGETFFEIFPKNQQLEIETYVAPKDISEIRVGQSVEMVFASDHGQILHPMVGTVDYVSTDTVVHPDSGLAFYVVRSKVDPGQEDRIILPGNQADVFFKTTPRTLFEYLLEPITRFAFRSFKG